MPAAKRNTSTRTTGTTTSNGSTPVASEADLRAALQEWYRANGRHELPWRLTRDPYAVLVSEVMLQQTQVARALPYYGRWMTRWPTLAALAADSPAEAIREWAGLGYNRRALFLHRIACACVERHEGGLPRSERELLALPGIGPYTARAVACFALDEPTTPADTNIARVIARMQLGEFEHRTVARWRIDAAARDLMVEAGARDHNLALMDLGAMACTARNPACERCPLSGACNWFAKAETAPVAVRETAPAFATTARFARGRIVDALRGGPCTEDELGALLPEQHAQRLPKYLEALAGDRLIELQGEAWCLVGDSAVSLAP